MISTITRFVSLFFALRQDSFMPPLVKECPVEEVVAQALNRGKTCVFVDTTRSFDLKLAARHGSRTDELIVLQPSSREEAIGICEKLIESRQIDLLIVDSLSALTMTAELEGLTAKDFLEEETSYRKNFNRFGMHLRQTRTQCIFLG